MIHIRIRLAVPVLCIIAALLLSGCLGVKTPPVTRADPPSVFIDYQRTGGFAGVNDRIVIFDNGAAVLSGRTIKSEMTLNKSELENLGALFEANRFASLEGNYTSRRGGADFLHYSITFKGKTVQTEDTAVPPSLEPIILEMNRILARGESNASVASPLPVIRR
ncbi:MAG: hypothetical protein GYA23_03250 [Methanomicrobiales archaeon]|nr:hypothetical protein [Methanomicrobiales archaeon]